MNFPPPSDKQAKWIWISVTVFAVSVLLALIIMMLWGVGWLLRLLSPVLWPLAIAAALAYLLDPVVDAIEKQGVPRLRSVILVFASGTVLLAAGIWWIVPQAAREARQFAERLPRDVAVLQGRVEGWVMNTNRPAYWDRVFDFRSLLGDILPEGISIGMTTRTGGPDADPEVEDGSLGEGGPVPAAGEEGMSGEGLLTETNGWVGVVDAGNGLREEAEVYGPARPDWSKALDSPAVKSVTAWLAGVLPAVGSWLFGQFERFGVWFGFTAGIFLVPVYVFFFLAEKQGIERQWTDYLPVRNSRFKDELVFCLRSVNDYLIVFFRSQVLVAICDAILYTIGFVLIGLPYAFLLGLASMVLTIIPFIGATVICVAAVIIGFASSGDWNLPVMVLVIFAIVQTAEGLVIQPKIVGDRVGLHPLTIIVAVLIGTTLFGGLLGGILAIPLTAAMRVIMFRYVWVRRLASEELTGVDGLREG